VNATTDPSAGRRQQYQRATVAELVRLIAFCDQKELDFEKLVDDAQEIYRRIKADESIPAFLRRPTS
jgi:hypothetical protein